MSLLSLPLLLSLAQAPVPCEGERVVLVPFERVALPRAEARALEESVRRAVADTRGVCLESREQTVARLRAQGTGLSPCADAACRGARVEASGADRLVLGVALGVGGERGLSLALVDRHGTEARTTLQLPAEARLPEVADPPVREAFGVLWAARPSPREVKRPARVWPPVLLAAGGVALAAGVGFGLAAQRQQALLSEGNAGCTGEGEAWRNCFATRMEDGRRQARTSNALLGLGALLGAGGTVFLLWELP